MAEATNHVDVIVIGAGLSGIGAAAQIVRELPGKSFTVLESRNATGGTWDLFRYPGIRSDSDMYTFGYSFKPWKEPKAISDGASIKRYIEEASDEYGITPKIRYNHRVISAEWSSKDALWTVTAERADTGEQVVLTASWVIGATGYYRYDEGYRPTFEGEDRFDGQIIHPQHWPENLDYTGKRVVVVGSGATAVTLLPNLADKAAHVTMLQRTPTYVGAVPAVDPLANTLRRLLPESVAYPALRWKNMLNLHLQYTLSRKNPEMVKAKIRKDAIKMLPEGFDVDKHFNPPYNPWDQRLCAVPDGDLFTSIREGKASIATGRIRTLTEDGIELESGEHIPADIIVTATGLNLQWLGGMTITVDGDKINIGERFAYKGMMISGIPNLSLVTGYTNNSWTLKADLVSRYATRLIAHLDEKGYATATPITPTGEKPGPFLDLDAGYIRRGIDGMAKQGEHVPWRLHQNYMKDIGLLSGKNLEDGVISFQTREALSTQDPQLENQDGLRSPGTQTISVHGRKVRFRDEGEGIPVLMIHGIGRSLEDWNEQHELLAGKGYRLISVDMAGFGESEAFDESYSIPALARFVEAFLEALGITEPVNVVGNSLGGGVAMQLAVNAPRRVRSLVLADSAGFGREVAMPVRLMSVRPIGEKLLAKPSLASARRLELSLFHDSSFVTDERSRLGYRLAKRPNANRVFLETAGSLGTIRGSREEWRKELIDGLQDKTIPILAVWGEKDTIFPASQLEAAAAVFPRAQTHLFPNTGHMPMIERAQEFADLATAFWAKQAAQRQPVAESAA